MEHHPTGVPDLTVSPSKTPRLGNHSSNHCEFPRRHLESKKRYFFDFMGWSNVARSPWHGLKSLGKEESPPWRYDVKRLKSPMLVKPIIYHAKYLYIFIYIICDHQGTEHWITRWGHNFSGHLWSVRGGSQSRNESSSSMSRRDGSAAKPGGWTVYNWHAYSLTVPLHFYMYCLVAYSQRSPLQTQVFHNAPDGYNPQFVQSRGL